MHVLRRAFRLFFVLAMLHVAACDGGGSGGGNGGGGGTDITGDSTPPINIVGMVRSNMANDVMAVVSIYDVSADHRQSAATVVDDLTVTVNEVALTCTDTGSAGYKYINNNLQLNPTGDLALGYKGGNTYTLKVMGTPTLADGLTYDVDVTAMVTVPTTAATGFAFKSDWLRHSATQSFQYTAGDAAKVDVTVNVLDASANVLQCYNYVAANASPYTLSATDAYAYAVGGVDATQMQIRVNSYNETLIPDYDYLLPAPVSDTQIASKFVALPELAGSGYEGEATISILYTIPISVWGYVGNNGLSDVMASFMIYDVSVSHVQSASTVVEILTVTVNDKPLACANWDSWGKRYFSNDLDLNPTADINLIYKQGNTYTVRITGTPTLANGYTYPVDITASVVVPHQGDSGFTFPANWDKTASSVQIPYTAGDAEKISVSVGLWNSTNLRFRCYDYVFDNVSPITLSGVNTWLYVDGSNSTEQAQVRISSYNETPLTGYDYYFRGPASDTPTASAFVAMPELTGFALEGSANINVAP